MLETWLALARVHFKQYSIYKSNFFLWTLNRIVEVVVYVFIWQAIYYQTGNAGGYSLEYMVTYYILVISIKAIATWGINEDIAKSIRKGQLNKELLSPMSYFKYCFGLYMGEIGYAIPISIATFVVCSIFWSVQLPVSFINFLLFIFEYNTYTSNIIFYTNDSWNNWILYKFNMGNANFKTINYINFFWINSTTYIISRMVSKNCKYTSIQRIYIYSYKYLFRKYFFKRNRFYNIKINSMVINFICNIKSVF